MSGLVALLAAAESLGAAGRSGSTDFSVLPRQMVFAAFQVIERIACSNGSPQNFDDDFNSVQVLYARGILLRPGGPMTVSRGTLRECHVYGAGSLPERFLC